MYYELYADSLFLMNFVMNLYLLLLVNRSLFRTATRKRLLIGAGAGALCYFLPFFCDGPLWFKLLLGIVPGEGIMIVVAFRTRSLQAFWRVLEKLLMYSVLLGGCLFLILRQLPWLARRIVGVWGMLGLGALLYLVLGYLTERRKQNDGLCKVTLIGEGCRMTVTALLDSGNSLVEPISGKPVSIIEKELLAGLWKEEPLYRAIPYHSIGRKRGILKGYHVSELQIEINGVLKVCKDTYVAVCEEYITSERDSGEYQVKMILNPRLLEKQGTEPAKVHERRKRISEERYG